MKRPLHMSDLSRMALAFLTGLAWGICSAEPANSATSQTYDFKVSLDDQEIGSQRFDVSSDGKRTQVRVDAQFKVKFLLITAYTYKHTNAETWEGACLQEIRAETDDNGEPFFVRGTYRNTGFQWQTQAGKRTAEGCVKTFAYWNPDWLTGTRLLNSQTGELDRVEIREVGEDTIPVHGVPTRTAHRRIITDQFTIDLWYTLNGDWVALQSTTKKGKTLHYTLR